MADISNAREWIGRLRRFQLAVLIFAMGAIASAIVFVDTWEGARCWESGASYARLPFGTAFAGAWKALLADMPKRGAETFLTILGLTAFGWPAAACLRARGPVIPLLALLSVAFPFTAILHDEIASGLIPYCDGSGLEMMGFFSLQFFVVLPAGIILLAVAVRKARAARGACAHK